MITIGQNHQLCTTKFCNRNSTLHNTESKLEGLYVLSVPRSKGASTPLKSRNTCAPTLIVTMVIEDKVNKYPVSLNTSAYDKLQ